MLKQWWKVVVEISGGFCAFPPRDWKFVVFRKEKGLPVRRFVGDSKLEAALSVEILVKGTLQYRLWQPPTAMFLTGWYCL